MSRTIGLNRTPAYIIIILVVVLVAIGNGQPSQAAPGATYAITVDTTDDHYEDNACTGTADDCSLRGAISYANEREVDSVTNITIPAGTYYLALVGSGDNTNATGDLDVIERTVTLTGSGTITTIIHGMDDDRVLDNNGGDLTLEHLRITHGEAPSIAGGGGGIKNGNNSILNLNDVLVDYNVVLGNIVSQDVGGGISNHETLTIKNSTISHNTACGGGGVNSSYASLFIYDSTISQNQLTSDAACLSGGGLGMVSGSLQYVITRVLIENNSAIRGGGIFYNGWSEGSITDSTIRGNTASSGGGLYNLGILTLNRVTVSGNHANNTGNWGGGIDNWETLTITNSTISGNSAYNAGGLHTVNGSTAVINHCTFADNTSSSNQGQAIYLSSNAINSFHNTIVFSSVSGDTCHKSDESAVITDLGYNMSSDHSCLFSTAAPYYDLIDAPPSLGPLQDNGGLTYTRAMLAMSLGLDMADPNSSLTVDQRSYFRPINWDGNGARADIGAFEWNSFPISLLDKLFHLPLIMKPSID